MLLDIAQGLFFLLIGLGLAGPLLTGFCVYRHRFGRVVFYYLGLAAGAGLLFGVETWVLSTTTGIELPILYGTASRVAVPVWVAGSVGVSLVVGLIVHAVRGKRDASVD